jgi:hypothetical protein
MKPTPLHPLRPSRRLFTVPACVRLRRLLRLNARVCDLAYAVIGVAGCVLIARFLSIGFVPA